MDSSGAGSNLSMGVGGGSSFLRPSTWCSLDKSSLYLSFFRFKEVCCAYIVGISIPLLLFCVRMP